MRFGAVLLIALKRLVYECVPMARWRVRIGGLNLPDCEPRQGFEWLTPPAINSANAE
jgi:hypothetical protein